MRRTGNMRSLRPDVTARVKIGIGSVAAPITTKACPVPKALCRTTSGAGGGGVRWCDRANGNAHQGREQDNPFCKVPGCMPFPSDKPFRVFQTHASTCCQCHGHQQTGFTGENLSLRGSFNPTVNAPLLVHCQPVPLSLQDGAKVRPAIAIRAGDAGPDAYVNTNPLLSSSYFRQGDADSAAHVPLAILPEHFPLLTQGSSRHSQSTVDGSVPVSRDVEFAHALNHYPQVKALCLPWLLNLSRVDNFSLEMRGLELLAQCPGSLRALVEVGGSSAISAAYKLPLALTRGDTGLLHACHLICAIYVQASKQPRQEGQRIGLVARGVQFKFVRENRRLHVTTVSERRSSRNPMRSRVSGCPYPDNAWQRGANCLARLAP